MQKFTIPMRLPSLNEYIEACRRNPHAGAKLKRDTDDAIKLCIMAAKLRPVECPCIVHMVFTEPNRRRDVDNVESAKKYILDALTGYGVLRGDGPRWVVGVPSYTEYGDPGRVDVTIREDQDAERLREILRNRMTEEV
jgi:Holliday junction resolvase RusA-like endonuclease